MKNDSNNVDNANNITNKSNENINNNSKNKSLLYRICTVISIIIAILGSSIGIYVIVLLYAKNGGGLVIGFLVFAEILSILFYTATAIGTVWIIYWLITKLSAFYKKSIQRKK